MEGIDVCLNSHSWKAVKVGFKLWDPDFLGFVGNYQATLGFPGGASGKESACQCRRHKRCRFDPWVGKVTWRRRDNGSPFQYSCLENPTDRGAWWATVHGVAKSQT